MRRNDVRREVTKVLMQLSNEAPDSWQDILDILKRLPHFAPAVHCRSGFSPLEGISKGVAFLTFDFGIDGVSIEISKYAGCIEKWLTNAPEANIHLIGGDFHPQSDILFKEEWPRFKLAGGNGWEKWNGGRWFDRLFLQDMPEGSRASREMAHAIWRQGTSFARRLADYLLAQEIALLIPVNVCSNPGNFALALGLVLASEVLGLHVLNSNHDFYWEDGKPPEERLPDEEPGSRDHFFRNMRNRPFFAVLQRLYPWDGRYWLQVNINGRQKRKLIEAFHFSEDRVHKISTAVSESCFATYSREKLRSIRRSMSVILGNGNPLIRSVSIRSHLHALDGWMQAQHPVVCGAEAGLELDLVDDRLIYLLQPTRVIARKRIERDIHLLGALFQHPPFRSAFSEDRQRKIVLHITGPTPVEHKGDLERVLQTFLRLVERLPEALAGRVFLAFSVGMQAHPSFVRLGLPRLSIADIYHLATLVLFPSETEGRGLPIIEAGACGVPIVCSRYAPAEVFDEVVGRALPEEQQIRHTEFPESEFTQDFLHSVCDILLHPEASEAARAHNRQAVRLRYSEPVLCKSIETLLIKLSSF